MASVRVGSPEVGDADGGRILAWCSKLQQPK